MVAFLAPTHVWSPNQKVPHKTGYFLNIFVFWSCMVRPSRSNTYQTKRQTWKSLFILLLPRCRRGASWYSAPAWINIRLSRGRPCLHTMYTLTQSLLRDAVDSKNLLLVDLNFCTEGGRDIPMKSCFFLLTTSLRASCVFVFAVSYFHKTLLIGVW